MKTWLKGGLIGSVISIILLIAFLSTSIICTDPYPGCTRAITQINLISLNIYLIFIFSIIVGFIIGAIIGLIIQKMKESKIRGRRK